LGEVFNKNREPEYVPKESFEDWRERVKKSLKVEIPDKYKPVRR
jgi:hypothetical protein